ncbi:hypothetical protein DET65_0065 [Sunxiuqinia elliptica]|uniref:Uncharacterized protein n=1 Tax=Sunxiuqinia elliptica TaxID=655355 RepID=A0A4V3BWS2_9BACT|nr:hypothetical protein DET52_11265 [Sunxiuqinia elliptica]TDO67949.1 hypothetical protein DET65_0065 [Sunxiuqinia elliptica]
MVEPILKHDELSVFPKQKKLTLLFFDNFV